MNNVIEWAKKNILLAGLSLLAVMFIFFPKVIRFGKRRVHHSRAYYAARREKQTPRFASRGGLLIRRPSRPSNTKGKSLPRSVGTKGYAAAGGGYIPFKYNKDGSVKKAWQVAGTVAAKSRMSRLRRQR